MDYRVQFLERQFDFDRAMEGLENAPWIGFDTEFVGEKTYVPILCLLQIVADKNIYLVDTLRISDLSRFLRFLEDPEILKITHAGDNDYRLLYTLYGVTPSNTFDTQIAAGFVGYNYPAGFGKIVEKEIGVTLAKSHTVADWEARPLDRKAVDYAVEDVRYLPDLHEKLSRKLTRLKRTEWAREENRKWETPDFYEYDPFKEVLSNDMIHQLDYQEKIFLIRLYQWRRDKAAELNVPKETILQSRHVSTVVRAMKNGQSAFRANRTLPENVWRKNLQDWELIWRNPVRPEEKAFLEGLPKPFIESAEMEWTMEMLYHLVKLRCIEHEISAALLLPRGEFNRFREKIDGGSNSFLSGWRAELLGAQLVEWINSRRIARLHWESDGVKLSPK
jgi:ribonuclease D